MLLVTSTVWVARVARTELAVHFSFVGEPSGFMMRGVYLGFVLGLAALLCVIVPVAMVAEARRGHRVSAIANAGYWSRRENRTLHVERLTGLSLFAGAAWAVLISGGNMLALAVNGDATGRMPPLLTGMAVLIVALAVAALAWASRWYGRLPQWRETTTTAEADAKPLRLRSPRRGYPRRSATPGPTWPRS